MIRNGYYFPAEIWKNLVHYNKETDEIEGTAAVAMDFGTRSAGKTAGHSGYLTKDFIENGNRFCLACRTQKQKENGYLKKWYGKFLNISESKDKETQELLDYLKNHEIKIDNDNIYLDDKIMAYCVALSMSGKVKDEVAFDHCRKLVIDEAIRPGERSLWIQGQSAMQRIWDIFWTMARGDDLAISTSSIIFISNVFEYDNWVFNDFKVFDFFKPESKFTCQKGFVINKVENKIKNKEIEDSIMGNLMKRSETGSKYLNSAIRNEYSDNSAFVEKKGLNFDNLKLQLFIKGSFLGIFYDNEKYHVAKIEKDERSKIITMETKSHSDDVKLEIDNDIVKSVKRQYIRGKATFQTQDAKDLFLDFIGFL